MSGAMTPVCNEIAAEIGEERRDALLSALRRGAVSEAIELLGGWMRAWPRHTRPGNRINALSVWLRDECLQHLEDGRVQHALALFDRYILLPAVLTATDARERDRRLS